MTTHRLAVVAAIAGFIFLMGGCATPGGPPPGAALEQEVACTFPKPAGPRDTAVSSPAAPIETPDVAPSDATPDVGPPFDLTVARLDDVIAEIDATPMTVRQRARQDQDEKVPNAYQESEETGSAYLTPVDSRYILIPAFDRYGRRGPFNPLTLSDGTGEYPIIRGGGLLDPYNTNILKGDEPIYGEHLFLLLEFVSNTVVEYRELAGRADRDDFDVKTTQFLSADLFYGDTVFRPPSWRIKATFAHDTRHAEIVTNHDVETDLAIQELFAEVLVAEFDPFFDFISVRAGRQGFTSDFRSFVFNDVQDGARIFGTAIESRIKYDLAIFELVEKDAFSALNRTTERREQTFVAGNLFVEDWPLLGYVLEFTVQYVDDYAANDVEVFYLGFLGEGRIGRFEVAHAIYWALGDDSDNPISGRNTDVSAGLFALEVAYPMDWHKFLVSVLFATGDADPNDDQGRGFDGVFDNPDFAGGAFGFWHHQTINPGSLIANGNSFYPNLRTKANNAPNFVNPGIFIVHAGWEAVLSNWFTVFLNASYMRFVETEVLEQVFNRPGLDHDIGVDLSLAVQYRPLGIDNVIVTAGVQALIPMGGFKQIQGNDTLFGMFVAATIVF